jgi:predicted ATPase
MVSALNWVRIRGLTSISDLTLSLATPVTVLVGANGTGKSNLVGSLQLLGRIVDGQLQESLVRSGGFASLPHRSPESAGSADHVEIEVRGQESDGLENGYRLTLRGARGDEAVLQETLILHDVRKHAEPGQCRRSRRSSVTSSFDRKVAG